MGLLLQQKENVSMQGWRSPLLAAFWIAVCIQVFMWIGLLECPGPCAWHCDDECLVAYLFNCKQLNIFLKRIHKFHYPLIFKFASFDIRKCERTLLYFSFWSSSHWKTVSPDIRFLGTITVDANITIYLSNRPPHCNIQLGTMLWVKVYKLKHNIYL